MTVKELIQELTPYDGDAEVRVVDREAGWDNSICLVTNETYGLDAETQVGLLLN